MPDDFFQLLKIENVHIIELSLAGSLESETFDKLNQDLLTTLDSHPGVAWIIDVSAVNYMGSSVLGLFVNLRQHIKTHGGRLVMCGLSPRLTEVFMASSLQRLFTLRPTVSEAMLALGVP